MAELNEQYWDYIGVVKKILHGIMKTRIGIINATFDEPDKITMNLKELLLNSYRGLKGQIKRLFFVVKNFYQYFFSEILILNFQWTIFTFL